MCFRGHYMHLPACPAYMSLKVDYSLQANLIYVHQIYLLLIYSLAMDKRMLLGAPCLTFD